MNEENNLPRSEFFASLNQNLDIKTLDDFLDEEEWEASAKAAKAAKSGHYGTVKVRDKYGTLPALPMEPRNSPAALSERRRAIRRADIAREVIGWAIVALAIVTLGIFIL